MSPLFLRGGQRLPFLFKQMINVDLASTMVLNLIGKEGLNLLPLLWRYKRKYISAQQKGLEACSLIKTNMKGENSTNLELIFLYSCINITSVQMLIFKAHSDLGRKWPLWQSRLREAHEPRHLPFFSCRVLASNDSAGRSLQQ